MTKVVPYQCWAFSFEFGRGEKRSRFNVQCSTLKVQSSMFNVIQRADGQKKYEKKDEKEMGERLVGGFLGISRWGSHLIWHIFRGFAA